jgi:hypothetical protein
MTPEAIYRALCEIDPALEPWQKCEHHGETIVVQSPYLKRNERVERVRCAKCGQIVPKERAFGDGKPRYQTVDELLELCERLNHKSDLQGPCDDGLYYAVAMPRWRKYTYHNAHAQYPVAALQEAILRAMGGWTE